MSDYDIYDESLEDGAPYELYEWVGTYRNYYMTTDRYNHTLNEKVYIATEGLSRSEIICNTHEDNDSSVEIKIPISNQIVKDYGFQISPPRLFLNIYRFHRGTSTYVIYFKGEVNGIETTGEESVFKIPNTFGNILSGNIPNVYIQPPCNHVLFDTLCKVDKELNSVLTTIEMVYDLTIVVNTIGLFPDNWMKGGEISFAGRNERRTITSQIGRILHINYSFGRAGVGEAVIVTAGCDHSFTSANGCPKFSNQLNFGGQPFVPGESDNIFIIGV